MCCDVGGRSDVVCLPAYTSDIRFKLIEEIGLNVFFLVNLKRQIFLGQAEENAVSHFYFSEEISNCQTEKKDG